MGFFEADGISAGFREEWRTLHCQYLRECFRARKINSHTWFDDARSCISIRHYKPSQSVISEHTPGSAFLYLYQEPSFQEDNTRQ
jgi:hypothetical protein